MRNKISTELKWNRKTSARKTFCQLAHSILCPAEFSRVKVSFVLPNNDCCHFGLLLITFAGIVTSWDVKRETWEKFVFCLARTKYVANLRIRFSVGSIFHAISQDRLDRFLTTWLK